MLSSGVWLMGSSPSGVLLVYHFFPKYRDEFLKEGKRKGWSFAADRVSKDAAMEPAFDALYDKKFFRLENRWLGPFLWQKGLVSLVFREKWRAVILLGSPYYLANFVAALVCRFKGVPVFFWTHGARPESKLFKDFLMSLALAPAAGVFVYGRKAVSQIARWWLPAERFVVVYNSLNALSAGGGLVVDRLLKQGALKEKDCFAAIFVGRLVSRKRLDLLIRAVHVINQSGKRLRLLIVGDGPELGGLRELVLSLGLTDAVEFKRACYEEDQLRSEFSKCDFSVVPHAAGLSVVHAMAYGLPVITDDDYSAHGPEVEVLEDGVNCLIYRSGSLDALAQSIDRMICNYSEIVDYQRMREVVDLFSPAEQVELMERKIGACGA